MIVTARRASSPRFLIPSTARILCRVSARWFEIISNDNPSSNVNRHILDIPDTTIETPQPLNASSHEARFRNEMGQISRHSAVFFAGTLFTAGAGYLFKIYLARVLGAEALGIFALGMTIVGFFGLFNGMGLAQAAVRFVAAYSATEQWQRLRGFLGAAFGMLAILNVVLAVVMMTFGPWLARTLYHAPALIPYLRLFAVILVLGGCSGFLGQVLAGYKDIALRTIITNFIGSPLNILFGVVLLSLGFGLRGYLLAQVAGTVVVSILLLAAVWRLTPKPFNRASTSVPMEREVFWFSAAAFGVSLLEFVLGQSDKILLGVFVDVRQVGIYSVAVTLVAFVPVALQSVNQIFSPTIADLHARGDRMLLGRLFQTLTKWILGSTLPLALVMIVFAKPLMRLFGPAFEAGWLVLTVGTLGQLVNAGVGSVGYLLLMSGNQARLIRVQAIMSVFMVTATFGLVRPFGMVGAALAAALTNALSNYLYLRQVRTALQLSPYNRSYVRLLGPFLASLVVTVGLRLLVRSSNLHLHPEWLWIGIALVIAYASFFGLALLAGLDKDDKMIVTAIRNRVLGAMGRTPSLQQ
jgi:O-antigen/teichoic acid export membrane protein